MIFFIYLILITTFLFSNEDKDTLKINIAEIKIYGGIDENSISTDIDLLNNNFSINGKNDFKDLIQSSPSIHYSGGTSIPKYFQLRGLGELSQFSGEGPPHFYVGYIVDNIDFSGIGMIGKLYDIQQIEIFKGPQSSAYGPNSMAGIINLISNKPTNKPSFNFNTSIYSNNGQSFNLSTSIPISDKILTKLTISSDYTNGFITNISDNENKKFDSNSKDENLLKIQIGYNPKPDLAFDFVYYLIDLDNNYDVWTPDNNGFNTYSDFQGQDKQKSNAYSLTINHKIKEFNFTSISTYSKNDIVYSYDGDWGNNNFWSNDPYNWNSENPYYAYYGAWEFKDITNRNRTSYSQEFRLKRKLKNNLTMTSGLYLSKLNEEDYRDGWLFAGYAQNINSTFDISNYAIYNKLSYPISNKLIISSTLRYDYNLTKQDLNYLNNGTMGSYINEIKDRNLIGGNIKLNYKYDNFTFLNASVSRGYKTAGINQTQAPFLSDSLKLYNTEFCNNIDIGAIYAQNNLKIELSAFYMHRINPQLRLSYQIDPNDPTSFDYATFNAKSGYNYGFEFSLDHKISKKVTLGSYLSYLQTHVSSFSYLGTTYGNRALAHSPNNKYGFSLIYDLSERIRGLNLNINSNYIGYFYFEEQNNVMSNPYNLIDISFNYKVSNIELSLWSKNVTNTKYSIRGYQFVLDPTYEVKDYQSFGDPRSIGITLDYNM